MTVRKFLKTFLLALFCFLLGVVVSAYWGVYDREMEVIVNEEKIVSEETSPTIEEGYSTILLDDGENYVYTTFELSAGDTVLTALEKVTEENDLELVTSEYEEMGVLVEQVGEKENGAEDLYWQYWVDDTQPQVSADNYEIEAGDLIVWKYTDSTF